MPKQKLLLQVSRKKEKQRPAGPETADEFLAAGVDLEEAGEKWRAGDAAKSSRFFTRAIDVYDAALRRYPNSFDLAYNKARLQYDISQQPRLLNELATPAVALLQSALDSHRYALNLRQDDADTLFNTAQVLTSLAETLSEGDVAEAVSRGDALKNFREALELFQRCLSVQEYRLSEVEAMRSDTRMDQEQGQALSVPLLDFEDMSQSLEEQWVSIVQPITATTLLDTMIAQIETLTSMCSLMVSQDSSEVQWLEEYFSSLLDKASRISNTERRQEMALARANFLCTYADASYRLGRLDFPTYEAELKIAFNNDLDLSVSPQALCDRAEAFINFVTSTCVTVNIASLSIAEAVELKEKYWKCLTHALGDLTKATKIPNANNLATTHLRRGDCEVLRYRLGESPAPYEQAAQNTILLLKNAETYYRGAAKLAEVEMAVAEQSEALIKEAVASGLNKDWRKFSEWLARDRIKVASVVEEMREENMLSDQNVAQLERLQ